jgi:hypothetical protein
VRRLILSALAVGMVLAGCSSVASNGGFSFRDGENFAQAEIQQGNPLVGDPQVECQTLEQQGSIPDRDDKGQWLAGCQAALANASFIGGSTGTG